MTQTILGIPGLWAHRGEILISIAGSNTGYLFAGQVLLHVESKRHFKLEIYERDASLGQAFAIAGRGRLSAEDLEVIERHTFCLYLIAVGGSAVAAHDAMLAANALLASGGIAVKVESAGIAHSADGWKALSQDGELAALFAAYVTYAGKHGEFYSCGMHNLGHPDCVVEAEIPPADAANLMHTFLTYLLFENPTFHDGETFSISADAPHYRLTHEPCTQFAEDDPFYNEQGIWKLELANEDA